MYDQKREKKKATFRYVEATVIISLLAVAGLTIFYSWTNSNNSVDVPLSLTTQLNDVENAGPTGVVDTLGQQTAANPVPTPAPVKKGPPFTIELPEGWDLTETNSVQNPCNPTETKLWVTNVYEKDNEVLTIYENGHPNGCSNEKVADVYLDFDYTFDNKSLLIDTSAVTFCGSSTPTCPKGDGRVSIFVGNKTSEDENYELNLANENTYFFSILDTQVDSDLDKQVRDLVVLLELIQFN
ncbi:MAG: hypothetical protein ACI9T8_000473 [Candidatus Saccharimonadales bacterium]|jgi:hypothetical protein